MKTVKIFVYGTLKKGGRNHDRFCGNEVGIEPTTVNGKLYDTGWGFPAMQLSDKPDDIVHGEIITIPEADLPAIDRLEGVPRLYQRVKAMAVSEAGTKSTTYCYVMEHLPPGAIRREGWLEMRGTKKPRTSIKVPLTGEDGNAFAIIGRVRTALRRAGYEPELIEEFTREAMSGDYDHLIQTVLEYVDAE